MMAAGVFFILHITLDNMWRSNALSAAVICLYVVGCSVSSTCIFLNPEPDKSRLMGSFSCCDLHMICIYHSDNYQSFKDS